MPIPHGLPALLEHGPRSCARLRAVLEARTGALWALNAGHAETALAGLERDRLVTAEGRDARGRTLYALTDAGRAELHDWYARPVERTEPRDELAIKLVMAVGEPGVHVRTVIETQRRPLREALREYTRQRCEALG